MSLQNRLTLTRMRFRRNAVYSDVFFSFSSFLRHSAFQVYYCWTRWSSWSRSKLARWKLLGRDERHAHMRAREGWQKAPRGRMKRGSRRCKLADFIFKISHPHGSTVGAAQTFIIKSRLLAFTPRQRTAPRFSRTTTHTQPPLSCCSSVRMRVSCMLCGPLSLNGFEANRCSH